MEVDTKKIRAAIDAILSRLEEDGCKFPIEQDFYWSVPKDRKYDPYDQPSELTLGQLSDDLQEVEKIANGEVEPISYGLVWIGSILQAIGENRIV